MIDPKDFYYALKSNDINFFTGVPDSLLSPFSAYISEKCSDKEHIIAANEGGAVALAAGHYLGTGNPALVYMQNSGLGNAVNPLVSLCSEKVYGIPMILMIGWRGEPGVKDEPQHIFQGEIQNDLLDLLNIPYVILDGKNEEHPFDTSTFPHFDISSLDSTIHSLIQLSITESKPVAIVVRKNTFSPYKVAETKPQFEMGREEAIRIIVDELESKSRSVQMSKESTYKIVSTTGKISRELYEYRKERGDEDGKDFLTVGSMGHASQIAMGMALSDRRRVLCLDGDGAVLMHLGALPIIANSGLTNYTHIVLNNGAHDSVGGQPTLGTKVNLTELAGTAGYNTLWRVQTKKALKEAISEANEKPGPHFIEVLVNKGSRSDLGRPDKSPKENKEGFMKG